jgi:hypothetical protein
MIKGIPEAIDPDVTPMTIPEGRQANRGPGQPVELSRK